MLNRNKFFLFCILLFCIPFCIGNCFYEGQNYTEGASWNSSCNICNCHSNVVTCTRIACPSIICQPGEVLTHPINECCPECYPVKKPCIVGSANYLHNDVWSYNSKCVLYQCQDGLSVPFIIQCPVVICNQGESLFTAPGECCPVCAKSCNKQKKDKENGSFSECFQNISITQDCDNKSYLKQNVSWKNQCTFCLSENNHMSCYNRKCHACPSHIIDDMCCHCSFVACPKNCLKCLDNDTSVCTQCKDAYKVIHNGKCVEDCPKEYFKDEQMICKSCSLNCQTCFGNMSSQCSSCKYGYLLQKGHCVKECDSNFYESNGYCFECHETCSSCVGPSDEDCITCALSGQLIQDGKCVDDCDGHFYISDGYCLSCNETCVRCLKNGSCQYCEKGFYLEDGVCLLECSPGYYAFMNAYCLLCHEECQSCFGPLSYQCTSCPFNQYLLQNSCVYDCGQGYFGDLGAGVCRSCHPKCRACLGGASDDKCLSCTSGYLLPYIGTHFGSCVQKCPDQYYLMESGTCGSCYETCQTCFGPNETECLSCNSTLLIKNGACVPHCSAGYFEDSGVCYACHPSCATCSGFGENDCYTCPHGRKSKYGKCIPVCDEGKYMNIDGLCIDCHSSCCDCMLSSGENKTVQCIKCKNQLHTILKDECLLECPSNFYLNPYGICSECHPTCATCEKTGATSCTSCWNGHVLTHLGTCEHQCHQGYFPSGNFCEACSADCYECISTSECLKCKGDLVLQFGKCISNCSEYHYLDTVSRQCKECSSECKSCRGPMSYECTSCFPGMLFEDGVCVNHCSAEFFQDGNICKTCDLKCQTCSSSNLCTSCKLPYLLQRNECVDDCGAGYFPDFETQTCEGCSPGCLSCLTEEYCVLCFDGFYLSNFKCVTQCPLEHYGDPLKRLCKKNTDVPSLHANGILKIQSGRKALISASLLSAYDSDSDFLLITVSNLPRNGYLVKMSEVGDEINLNAGENFTSTLLKDGWIFFRHLRGIPLDGNVSLRITDEQLMGNEISLPILVSSEFPPFIEQVKNIIVTEESSIVLNSSYFLIGDPDNVQDVTLNIVKGPCSGKLVLLPNETEVQTFSYEEFLQNKLVLKAFKTPLKHDDKFTIQISDGFNTALAEIKVFILPKQQKHLFLLRNNPFLVKFDEITKLTRSHLLAVGEDMHPNEIVFNLDSVVSPYGSFFKAVSNSRKKKKISSAKINFSQEDIDEELIFYKQFSNTTSNITIPIKASNLRYKTELNFDFEIRVLKYDAIMLNEETNQFGMMVLQDHPATITNDHLPMKFNGIPSGDIVYMITRKLPKEEGFLESLDKPGYRLQSFTQKEVDNMKIVYHPPPYPETSETNYIFQFIVLDTKRRIQLSPVQNFTITVRPQSIEFTSPSTSVDHEVTIIVPQGQSVELGSHWLSTVGHQIPDDQLEVVLNIAPQYGNLTQMQNGYDIKIEEEDGYSFISIIHDTYYTHDGSNKFKDFAVFKIMGGPYTSLNRINFMIAPNDKESPVILDSTSLMGSVTEGKYIDLKRHHLAYTDLVSGDHEIVYTLLDEPKYGKLSKYVSGNYIALKISDTFTQQDINDQQIRYIANDGIGNNTVKDFLSFDVSDGSGNVQPNQALTMKVKPKIREPPIVKVISDVKVNEGGEAIIEHNIMTVFDPDSPLSDLTVFIEKQPDFGFLENSREVVGAEKSIAGIPISKFSYVDLVEGYIKYIQITHRDVEPEKDTMYIRISDGYKSSPVHLVNITIKPMNDETPVVITQNLSVLQGSFVKILNSSLSISDEDTSFDQLIIHLDNPPHKGEIRLLTSNNYNLKDSKPILKQDTVTYQDVLDGLIIYVHEDSKSSENDSFSFTVSDGHHFVSDFIDIFIIVRDREVPYLVKNLGLELLPGESSIIDNETLSALDSDSSIQLLKYTLTSDLSSGELYLYQNGNAVKLSSKDTKHNYFTQDDIDNGKLFYRHNSGDPIGLHHFKFNIHDPANNTLMDQKFFISLFEDLFPPVIIHNTGLEVEEKSQACINSSILSAFDEHQKDKNLIFSLTSLPVYGYLVLKHEEEKPITNFFMSDLKAGFVCYVHKSDKYSLKDNFIFTVSDGKNYVMQPFSISIKHISNKMPYLKFYPLSLKEGSQKIISELEIDIFDYDSTDSQLIVSIISPPNHGKIVNSSGVSLQQFSFEDVKLGHVVYVHDDTDTTEDNFTFVLNDGLNVEFVISNLYGKNITTKDPVVFPIKILSLDDSFPVLVRNEGLHILKKDSDKVWGTISEKNLYTEDNDTKKDNILYHVTIRPRFGSIQLANRPNSKIHQFSQENIENGELLYVLENDDFTTTEDSFMFTVEDTKPNKIFRNVFSIHWSRISFNTSLHNISETSGLLEIPVKRTGNKKLDFTASCKLENTNSQNSSKSISAIVDEIHFRMNDDIKFCVFRIIDNNVFERSKEFKLFLESNMSLLAFPFVAVIAIADPEDEPTISFKESVFRINEIDGYFNFTVIREGDISQELSVLCTTSDMTAQGSFGSSLQTGLDYRSRDSSHQNFITFRPGVSEAVCSVKVIDDNLYEEEEEFLLELSKPHPVGKIKNHTAHIIIQGPNDVSMVSIQENDYEIYLGEQNSSVVILRQGVDLSATCTVWCGSNLLSSGKKEERMNSYYQITLQPFQTSAMCLVPTNAVLQKTSNFDVSLVIFIDSSKGCHVDEPSKITVPLKRKIVYPVVEFKTDYITVQENIGSLNITVLRSENISSSITLHCSTQDGTAVAGEDYEGRYIKEKNSLLYFKPEQKEAFCSLNIYDDDIFEGNETFQVFLTNFEQGSEIVTLGLKKMVTITVNDSDDMTVIELEKSHYLFSQNSFPNSSASAVISVLRNGDISLLSKVRISTIDGSALSGLDYYAKSKLLSFLPGEKKKTFEIEVLYNKRRNWALSFTVILGPDEVMNAEIGRISKALVTIPRVLSTESLILPSVPIAISLTHYGDVRKGLHQDAISGYPLICITPCDINYPDYAVTNALCRESGINASSVNYSWEIAMPLNSELNLSPFEKITDSTLFTSVYGKILDSVYFRPQERVRCVAQPVDNKGHLGIALRSKPIKISSKSGFCLTPSKLQYPTISLSSQPFIATLNYINSSDTHHPNKLHIHIEIPHEDGLIPLISTYPMHNIEFLLVQNIYRQQHICSNLLQDAEKGFLKNLQPQLKDINTAFPYHGEIMTKEMQLLYQHLDLRKCKWSFDAWYSMSELIELCGGSVISDFKARDTDKSYISVLLPLYVTYVFAAAPTGWTSVEHRTEIEFSFFYDTFLWKESSHLDSFLNASISIVHIGTDSSGHLFFEFKTVSKFYGCFVLEHHTLPGIKSYLTAPDDLHVKFDLDLLWSEQTFDGPIQFWKATSRYNLKDYSGNYIVHLIPCEVSSSKQFPVGIRMQFLPCDAKAPQKFELPIVFQQTVRPQPVTYALETFFQLFKDQSLFLLNPFENNPKHLQQIEYKGAFSRGDNVYGRVFWSPEQKLESAYILKINEVILCTGKNGYLPLYDPTGEIYGKGPQYGCLIPNKNSRHKFTLLNRYNPDAINEAFQGISFKAEFIENSPEYKELSEIGGVDGFVFNTDPLYEISPNQQWFLQVTYSIKPSQISRVRRSLESTVISEKENFSNIKMLLLKVEEKRHSYQQAKEEFKDDFEFGAHYVMYVISVLLIIIGIFIIGYRHPKLTKYTQTKVLDKYYVWTKSNTKPLNKELKFYKTVNYNRKIKHSEKFKVRVYMPKREDSYITDNSSETEV